MIECPSCKSNYDVEEFFDCCSSFYSSSNSFVFTCPKCKERIDSQVISGALILGYLYGAGEPHFAGMVEHKISGLSAKFSGSELSVSYSGGTWIIPSA